MFVIEKHIVLGPCVVSKRTLNADSRLPMHPVKPDIHKGVAKSKYEKKTKLKRHCAVCPMILLPSTSGERIFSRLVT